MGIAVCEPRNLESLLSTVREASCSYDFRDVALYAMGVGASVESATSPESLRLAYEDGAQVLPTMAVVLAWPGFWLGEPGLGLDWKQILHGEQSLVIHKPLALRGKVTSRLVVEDLYDRGAEKGAVLVSRRDLFDQDTGDHLATDRRVTLLRGDGGRGGRRDAPPRPNAVPDSAPDCSVTCPTRVDQALLYRLSGDMNPLHADPDIAAAAGFPIPILHGLCTFGIAGRAIVRGLCDGEASRLRRLDCRFSTPVFPGESIRTEIWRVGDDKAAFRCVSAERAVVVLNNGYAEYLS